MKAFDKKFGAKAWASVPASPGVYRFFGTGEAVSYVGKAKNLRRRLGQYRNAKRRKKNAKMRAILTDASRVEWQVCESPLSAELLECQLIRELRPKWNVVGAFSFIYPMLGMWEGAEGTWFCYTTDPHELDLRFKGIAWFGAYRSRMITKDAFLALETLIPFFAQPIPKHRRPRARFSLFLGFRGLPPFWRRDLGEFFRGGSSIAIEELVLSLTDSPAARKKSRQVQIALNCLKRFMKTETRPLQKALEATGSKVWPLPQAERDQVFIRFRNGRSEPPPPVRRFETARPAR